MTGLVRGRDLLFAPSGPPGGTGANLSPTMARHTHSRQALAVHLSPSSASDSRVPGAAPSLSEEVVDNHPDTAAIGLF